VVNTQRPPRKWVFMPDRFAALPLRYDLHSKTEHCRKLSLWHLNLSISKEKIQYLFTGFYFTLSECQHVCSHGNAFTITAFSWSILGAYFCAMPPHEPHQILKGIRDTPSPLRRHLIERYTPFAWECLYSVPTNLSLGHKFCIGSNHDNGDKLHKFQH